MEEGDVGAKIRGPQGREIASREWNLSRMFDQEPLIALPLVTSENLGPDEARRGLIAKCSLRGIPVDFPFLPCQLCAEPQSLKKAGLAQTKNP